MISYSPQRIPEPDPPRNQSKPDLQKLQTGLVRRNCRPASEKTADRLDLGKPTPGTTWTPFFGLYLIHLTQSICSTHPDLPIPGDGYRPARAFGPHLPGHPSLEHRAGGRDDSSEEDARKFTKNPDRGGRES
jgi:hypothetical protein